MKIEKVILVLIFLGLLSSCYSVRKMSQSKFQNEQQAPQRIALPELKVKPIQAASFKTVPEKKMDILHMDLDVRFNLQKHECIGKVNLLMTPYFYASNIISLDAQNMIIDGIEIIDQRQESILYELNYDQKVIQLKLERMLQRTDTINLTIKYIARPDLKQNDGGKAIRDDKGLYFINTNLEEPYKPVQIWTQGETESNSNWFPTVDKPHEKFTSILSIAAPKQFTILSNGKRVSSVVNDSIKIEKWVNDKPMSAYLIMMAIGKFDEVKDIWKQKEVNYYVEKEFTPYARNIFSNTIAMIDFYSSRLGVPYPWDKYSQVVVRDYVSGAMENTSATLHGEFVQKNKRELLDGDNEGIVSHELFHQWFGDLVTCETWSHLVLNEGFATYGEWLWIEHQKGRDAFLAKSFETHQRYLNYAKNVHDDPIVNFNYAKPDDMFNVITYQKGALVLNLLRSVVGDDAFFLSLKNYLTKYAFQAAQIRDLQREFERVSGKDLSAFFHQWFELGNHPILDVRYEFDNINHLVNVTVEQKQDEDVFHFPIQFKLKQGNKTEFFTFEMTRRKENFQVKTLDENRDDLPEILIDPHATFVGEIIDNKPILKVLNQYALSDNFLDKMRGLQTMSKQQVQFDTARAVLLSAINDVDPQIRLATLKLIDWKHALNFATAKDALIELSLHDESAKVRAEAMMVLANRDDKTLLPVFEEAILDASYTVAGRALTGLFKWDAAGAFAKSLSLANDAKGELFAQLLIVFAQQGTENEIPFFKDNLMRVANRKRADLILKYAELVVRLNVPEIETQQAIQTFSERASKDASAAVRLASVEALDDFEKKYRILWAGASDAQQKAGLQAKYEALQTTIQILVANEKDESILELLKEKGIMMR